MQARLNNLLSLKTFVAVMPNALILILLLFSDRWLKHLLVSLFGIETSFSFAGLSMAIAYFCWCLCYSLWYFAKQRHLLDVFTIGSSSFTKPSSTCVSV